MMFFKKLTRRNGSTLGEMLTAVLILMFLTMTVAGGMGVAVKVYRTEKSYSEARILANTVFLAMIEELRYASEAEADELGMSITYNSASYGLGTTLEVEEGEKDSGGVLKVTYGGDTKNTGYLYDESIYGGYRIQARKGQPVFLKESDVIVVTYDICDAYGNIKTSVEGVKIRLMNAGQ